MSPSSAIGIAAGFPTLGNYINKLTFGFDDEVLQENLARVAQTANEGLGFTYGYDDDDIASYTVHELGEDLSEISVTLRREAMRAALGGTDSWEKTWRRAVAYGYWALIMQMDARRAHIERNAASGDENWGAPPIEYFGAVAGDCLALGWNDYARDLANRSHWMQKMGGFPDGGKRFQRATQRFVLRLAEGGDAPLQGSVGVPEYDALLATWQTAPAADLAPLLLAACDRHTHQSRSTDTREEYDMPFRAFWYDPYEILSILQLRVAMGLDNPVLDHLLMNTPLGRLQPASPPVLDAALAAAVARVQSDGSVST